MTAGNSTRRTLFQAFLLLSAAVLLLSDCGGKEAVRPPPPAALPAGPKVAVAPMENLTNDLTASDVIRDAFVEGVARKGFAVMPVAESDVRLRETLGISYGGQLPATTPEEVCRELEVEGVFYGEVSEWGKTTTGIYNSATAAATFRLYRKDGALLWEAGDRQIRQDVARGGQNLGAEIVAKAIGNLLLSPLTPLGRRVGENIAGKLPGGALRLPPK